MLSTCRPSSVTSIAASPAAASGGAPLADPLAPSAARVSAALPTTPDPLAAPAAPQRARFRRLVVFDGRLA